MASVRFDRLLTGTAVALALALGSYGALAATDKEIAAAVPMPDTTPLPPPTVDSIIPIKASAPAPAADVTNSVPESTGSKYTTASVGDSAVADRLHDLFAAGKFDRILGGKRERGAIEAYYSSRNFAPLWLTDGAISARGKAAADYLAKVGADGLDLNDYPVPQLAAGADADTQAEAEIKLTDAVLTYARHATSGRVHYSRVSADIIYDLAKSDSAEVLNKLADTNDIAEALDSFEPQHPQYKALKAKLAEVRKTGVDITKPVIPSGPVLKYSGKDKKGVETLMEDERVPALRQWFSLKSPDGDTNYDKPLSEAIAKFQKERQIEGGGSLNQATLDALNGPKREKTIDIIVANMERWRWVPRDLGKTYVMVNIPDFTLRVVRDQKLVWKTKIVTGKPNLPTPLLSADMKFITVNPTWNVPPSIIQNEYLPALQQDPQAMERIGLKVEQNPDGTVRIFQPPGDRNALGRIRFNFPNKFLVYQHDTPDKHLFAHDKRAYSHGCMRVQEPLKYGEVLLSLALPQEHYTAERLQKMFGGSEININFPTSIPVHITYQTAFVDDGKLEIRDDVYSRDAKMIAIMHSNAERRVADVGIDRPKGSSAAPVRMPPGTFASPNGRGSSFFSGNSNFFGYLFGGPSSPAPKPRARVGSANGRSSAR